MRSLYKQSDDDAVKYGKELPNKKYFRFNKQSNLIIQ